MKNQFIIKHFMKSKAVKCYVIHADKRLRLTWVIPNGNDLTVGKYTFHMNSDVMYLSKSIPCFVFSYKNAEPLNIIDINQQTFMTAEDYDTAISSHVAREIFEASSKGMDGNTLLMVIGLGIVGVIGVASYLLYSRFDEIKTLLNQIIEMLRVLGGGLV